MRLASGLPCIKVEYVGNDGADRVTTDQNGEGQAKIKLLAPPPGEQNPDDLWIGVWVVMYGEHEGNEYYCYWQEDLQKE